MEQIKLLDSSFVGTESAFIGGDNIGKGPQFFRWRRDGPISDPTFFTDSRIKDVAKYGAFEKFVGLLLEPYGLRADHYNDAEENYEFFDTILTYEKRYLFEDPKYRFYPHGGSWIDFKKWGIQEKKKHVSIIASSKNTTEGHKLRHDVISHFGNDLDGVFGHGRNPVASKFEALADYRYSIVIESCREDFYFTEKLIDCFSVGTVPIYWGCPSIGQFFDPAGIIAFSGLDQLRMTLSHIWEKDYEVRMPAIRENLKRAHQYRICEDYIWIKYPDLFGRS